MERRESKEERGAEQCESEDLPEFPLLCIDNVLIIEYCPPLNWMSSENDTSKHSEKLYIPVWMGINFTIRQ